MIRCSFSLFVLFSASVFAQTPPTSFHVITADQPGSNAERFTRMFDRSEIWLGADGIYSIPLDGNDQWGSANKNSSTFFVFSDTMVGTADPETKRFRDANMVNHSTAVLTKYEPTQKTEREDTIRFFYGKNADGSRTNLFGKKYWLQDGIVINGKLYLTAFTPDNRWKPTQVDLLTIPVVSSETLDWEKVTIMEKFPLWAENDQFQLVFGIGILDQTATDGYVYVYGYRDTLRGGTKHLVVARVKPESYADGEQWRFWDGNDWSKDISVAFQDEAVLADRISTELSVTPIAKDQYLLVFTQNVMSDRIAYKLGSSPTGPFGETVVFYRAPEPQTMGSPIYSYNAKAHPHLSAPGLLLISYNVNRLGSLPRNTDEYRPRFIELPIENIVKADAKSSTSADNNSFRNNPMSFSKIFPISPMVLLGGLGTSLLSENDTPLAYSIGPGGGGAIMHPAINPHDANNIFLACDMGSSFISRDGGKSFQSHNFGSSGANDISRAFFSPHDPNVMYVAGGSLSSSSGVYYASGVLFVSHDKGETFRAIWPSTDKFVGIFNRTPYYQYTAGYLPSGYIYNVTVHPTEPNMLFVLTSRGTIHKSTDAGKTWTVFGTLPEGGATKTIFTGRNVANMMIFDNELRVAVDIGLFSFDLTSATRTDVPNSASKAQTMVIKDGQMTVCTLKDVENNANYVNHIFKTTDFGKTWVNISSNFKTVLTPPPGRTARKFTSNAKITFGTPTSHGYRPITVYDQNTLYVSFQVENGNYQIVGGVAKTTDGGNTWTLMFDSWNVNDGGFTSLDPISTTPVYGNSATVASYTAPNRGLIVSSVNPNHAIVTTNVGAYQTKDGGLKWEDLASCRTDNNPLLTPYNLDGSMKSGSIPTWTTKGIEPAGQHYLAINPHNKKDWITGWTDIGAWRSLDGGTSWTCLRPGRNEMPTCSHAAAFDPHNPGYILFSTSNRQSVGSFATATGTGAILCRSTNNGQTWTALPTSTWYSSENRGFHVSTIIYDPHHKDVVYVSAVGEGDRGGVWKSTDAGKTWKRIVTGIAPHTNSSRTPSVGIAPRLSLSNDGKTLLCRIVQQYTATRTSATDIAADHLLWKDAAAYKLDIFNGDTTWIEIPRPNDNAVGLRNLAMDNNGVLYATTNTQMTNWTRPNVYGARPPTLNYGGAYVSVDNGATWRQIFVPTGSAYGIRVDNRDNHRLYLSTQMGAVYVSYKGKETTLADWILLPGSTVFFGWQHIYEDPNDQNRIIVTSNCGGTWSMLIPPP